MPKNPGICDEDGGFWGRCSCTSIENRRMLRITVSSAEGRSVLSTKHFVSTYSSESSETGGQLQHGPSSAVLNFGSSYAPGSIGIFNSETSLASLIYHFAQKSQQVTAAAIQILNRGGVCLTRSKEYPMEFGIYEPWQHMRVQLRVGVLSKVSWLVVPIRRESERSIQVCSGSGSAALLTNTITKHDCLG